MCVNVVNIDISSISISKGKGYIIHSLPVTSILRIFQFLQGGKHAIEYCILFFVEGIHQRFINGVDVLKTFVGDEEAYLKN